MRKTGLHLSRVTREEAAEQPESLQNVGGMLYWVDDLHRLHYVAGRDSNASQAARRERKRAGMDRA